MTQIHSFDIEKDNTRGRKWSPYGQGGAGGPSAVFFSTTAGRVYSMFCLALLIFYFAVQRILIVEDSGDEFSSKRDDSGGWANQPVISSSGISNGGSMKEGWHTPIDHQRAQSLPVSNMIGTADVEMRESDLLMVISPLVSVPSHPRIEYEMYQGEPSSDDSTATVYSEDILYDMQTPHGMAFDFLLNRDKRPISSDESQIIQRFVLSLLFYATGGKDEVSPPESEKRSSGWDSSLAHFLTGLHECHWVKKSLEDQFWGILSIERDNDRRVGVTKCNSDMEVTEIRLGAYFRKKVNFPCLYVKRIPPHIFSVSLFHEADLNLIGFIPEEIKLLSKLESLDVQNNHLVC